MGSFCSHCRQTVDSVSLSSDNVPLCPSCHNPLDGSLIETKALDGGAVPEIADGMGIGPGPFGHFDLLEMVGQGSFGSVWRARDINLDRIVAVKIPRQPELSPEGIERFLREAKAAAQLRHPNIVGVHEVGRHAGTVYIASDFVRGLTLVQWSKLM